MDPKSKFGIVFTSFLLMIGAICFIVGVICFTGCDETPQARYDAMTGEKLSEKIDHLKDIKFEQKAIYLDTFRLRIFRAEIEGHVYYTRACGESSFTHSAACPCHTNNIERK